MRAEILLGFTKDNEVAFANIENNRNGQGYFSVSFDTSYPLAIGEELAIEQIESYIENMDKGLILDKLETYDCTPSQLANEMYNDSNDIVEDFFDNSLYTESFRINGVEDDIYFLASGGGQHDTRGQMKQFFVDEKFYNYLHELWDEYHLKEIPQEKLEELEKWLKVYENVDEYKLVENWLYVNFPR